MDETLSRGPPKLGPSGRFEPAPRREVARTIGGMERATIFVSGRVQGVGFRWWTRSKALELGLIGFARNVADGRVEVLAQGDRDAIVRLQALLTEFPSTAGRPGRVQSTTTQWGDPRADLVGFREL